MAQPPKRTRKAPIQQGNKNLDTPGTIYLQVIGTGAPGAPASVYIFSDQTRLDKQLRRLHYFVKSFYLLF